MNGERTLHEVSNLLAEGKLLIGDGYRAKNEELASMGLPFARAGNINNGFHFRDADRFPEGNLSRVGKKVSQPGDVVFTSKGTVGRFAFVRDNTPRFVYSPQLCFWRSLDSEFIHPRFLYYWMFGREFFAQYKGVAGQTDMAEYVSLIDQRRMHITLPNPDEQRSIANVLGALDNKIELNRRMNETLESTAQALFKSWFVDPTEKGLPDGWRRCSIRDLASNIQYGLTQSASSEPVGPRFLRITDIQGGNVDWGSVPFCEVSQEEYERYRVKSGDVLVARTGASTGENIYLPVVPDAVFASYLVRFQFSHAAIARFVGAFMRTSEYFDYVAGCIGGSAQPNASAQVLAGAELVLPELEFVRRYAEIVAPMDKRIFANNEESRTLAGLRDALLPKLLSGELRIKNAERIIGERA